MILGPTASGKTDFSINLAKYINGEIVSADSMQVYKYMDIGTAKPSLEEQEGIKHYLIDEITPDKEFSVAAYKELAEKYIKEILDKGKVPVVVGGTGLYINSLIYNINFSEIECDWELRDKLKKDAEEYGNNYLHDKLKEIDILAAEKIHPNNVKRVIRALEVYYQSNKSISEHQVNSRKEQPKYQYILLGLKMDRETLYEKVNKRVDIMFEKGLVNEVKALVKMGFDQNAIAMQAIGYKEVLLYLRGEIDYEEAIYIIKRNSRNYAKRQITWFRKLENIHWIDVGDGMKKQEILINIQTILKDLELSCKICL